MDSAEVQAISNPKLRCRFQLRLRTVFILTTIVSLALLTQVYYQRWQRWQEWNRFLAEAKSSGLDPLCWACRQRRHEFVLRLLRTGTSPNALKNGSPLHEAMGANDLPLVQLLLDNGADPNRPDPHAHLPLLHQMTRDCYPFHFGEMLIAAGADVDGRAANVYRETPLHTLCRSDKPYRHPQRWPLLLDWLNLLLDHGADIEARDDEGRTPLMLAVIYRKRLLVERLIERGARINSFDFKGNSVLTLSFLPHRDERGKLMQGYDHRIPSILLEAKANIHLGTELPLIAAVKHGDYNVVVKLLRLGADPKAKNKRGETAFEAGLQRRLDSAARTQDAEFQELVDNANANKIRSATAP